MVVRVPFTKDLNLNFPIGAFRVTRAIKYASFMIAAAITMFSPSNIIFGIFGSYEPFAYLWSILFFVGSAFSFVGVVTKKWTGEYTGLPGIICCLFLYSLGCFIDVESVSPQRVFLGFVFIAFTFSSVARRQDVKFQKRVAEWDQRVRDGKPGV